MKKAVNTPLITSLSRLLSILLILVGLLPCKAFAASVRWEVLPDRERLSITLNKEEGFAGNVARVSPTGLILELGVPTAGMGQDTAPANATLFKWTEPRGRALGIFMKTTAFGYVVTRPDRNTVIINAFPDSLGERWTPESANALPANAGTQPATPSSGLVGAAPEALRGDTGGNASSAERQPEAARSVVSSESVAEPASAPGVVRGRIENARVSLDPPRADAPPAERSHLPVESESAPQGASPQLRPASPGKPGATEFRARINPGSLSDWEDIHGKVAEQEKGTAQTQAADPVETPVVKLYVDAEGNPVPPPPNPVELLAEVKNEAAFGNYTGALEKLTPLLTHPELTSEQTEEILHLNAEMLFMANQDSLEQHFDEITSATIAAMNYNQNSPRNAAAYLRLGYINLKVGNTVEAEAYFSRLRRQYPLDENIALTYYYWGEYYYGRNEMQKAADEFQYIISNFSENKYARDAALGLARSYNALGYHAEAFDIVDYIERRWPRLYLESPPVLELMGDIAYRQGNLDFALDKYMTYYNLVPDGPNADIILTRIGDVHARKRQLAAAKTAYTRAETLFPGKDGGLVAMMRLAEVGINDAPELQTMFSVFQGPFTLRPMEIYTKIIQEHPESDLVPLAMLKLAMWYLWNKQYEECLDLCSRLAERFPNHELAPRAQEVAMKAFAALAAEGASQNRAGQVLENWSKNDIIRNQVESLSPESRVALAASMWKQNDPDSALAMVNPMFRGLKDAAYGEEALLLALTINLEHDQWQAIERLGEQVQLWELTDRVKQQLDYALALARENLGKSAEAAPIWSRLAEKGALPDKQQAYVEYFLAKDAETNRRLQDAYLLGKNALNRFLQMAQENPDHEDTGKINSLLASLMDITETAGRLTEALEYAQRYMARLTPEDSQRQGLLFRIAGIYKKQGNTPEWRKTLTELVEKYPNTVYGRTAASSLSTARLADEAAQFAPGGQL